MSGGRSTDPLWVWALLRSDAPTGSPAAWRLAIVADPGHPGQAHVREAWPLALADTAAPAGSNALADTGAPAGANALADSTAPARSNTLADSTAPTGMNALSDTTAPAGTNALADTGAPAGTNAHREASGAGGPTAAHGVGPGGTRTLPSHPALRWWEGAFPELLRHALREQDVASGSDVAWARDGTCGSDGASGSEGAWGGDGTSGSEGAWGGDGTSGGGGASDGDGMSGSDGTSGEVRIIHDAAGAPLLQGPDAHALSRLPSLTHSTAAFGFVLDAPGRPGLDTEPCERSVRVSTLLRRVASPTAAARIAALPPAQGRQELLRRWTRVEAVLKATGLGFGALAEIDVEAVASGEGVVWRHRRLEVLSWRWGGHCWALARDGRAEDGMG